MKYIDCSADQIKRFQETGGVLVEIPFASDCYKTQFGWFCKDAISGDVFIEPPVSEGDTVGLRESNTVPRLPSIWKSADTMPDEAIRFKFTVSSVEPVKIEGIWYWKLTTM